MKNRRILTKILLLVLTLATVIGAFAISGSAVDATKTLVEGIDFDGLAAAEPSSTTRDNIFNETGLYFATNANVAVQETPGDEGNMRLYFNKGANYIRPTFRKNDALLELLFTENGPKTFKLELDLAINNAFAGTAEGNDAKKNAITAQRGFSVLNIGSDWLFKATAPGAGTVNLKEGVTVNEKGVETSGGKYLYVESVNPGTENVGYFYKDAKNYYFPASAKMGWADAKYTGSTEGAISEGGKTYVAGYANGAASNAALQAVSYTVGVPQHFVISFTRTEVAGDNNDTMNVQVHVDGKLLVSSSTYTLNATNYKDGFRITDISGAGVSIDNFKVVLPTEDNNCQSGAHTSVDGWADTKVEFENAGDNAGVIYKVVCKDCGEIVNTDIYPNVIKTYGDIVGKTSAQFLEGFRSDVWDNYKNTPFWLSFDWTVNQLPTTNKSILAWRGNTKDGDVKNDVYVWPLRLWEDGTVKMSVENPAEAYVNFATPFKVSVGNTYRIDVRFDLAHSTFDVFADGVYLDTGYHSRLSSTNKEVGAYPMIRFIDGSTGKHDFTNIVITRGVTPESHKHNPSLSDEFDNGVLVDKTTIATSYTCYCGEIVSNGDAITKLHVDNLVDSYEGSAVIEGLPTEGEYWITFDYNVRNASAVSGSGVVIAKLGDTIIEDSHAAVPEVTTVNYAINVKYEEDGKLSYTVYENGLAFTGGSDITVEGDASVLTLGDSRVNDVRFNYVKVAEVSKGTAVVPTFTDNELRPCYHSNYAEKAVAIKLIDGSYYKTALCSECGERLDVKLVDKFDPNIQTKEDVKDRNFALAGNLSVNVYDSVKLTSSEYPYYMSFDVTVNSFDIATMLGVNGTETGGRNLFGTNGTFSNILRMFLIPDENSELGYRSDCVTVRSNNSTTADVVIEEMYKNETYRIVLAITPNTGKVDIYVNGEFAASRTIKITSSDDNFRFFEGPSWGTGTVENFSVAQNTTVETHIHSNKWLNSDELAETALSLADGNKVVYTYPCYCGETVTKGISEVTHDSLVPVFGNEGAVVAVENATIPTTDFTIIGKINARELPAEKADFIAVGEQVLVSIGADGKLYIGENAIDGAAFAAGRDYHEVAVYFDVDASKYFVMFDGAFVASAEYTELSGDLVFFAENGGVYNLERTVYATLEEGKDNAYQLGETDHVHYVVDASESGLTLKGHGLTATVEYTCAGCYVDVTEPVKNSEFLAVPLVDAYDFSVIVSPVANEESYWVFFDANNRAVIENGVLVKVGDAVLAEYKDGEIVGYNGVASGVKADKVGIHSIAVRVAAEDYMLYVDGKLVTTADVAELAEGLGDTLELGGAGCEKVRFNELLIVNFGATDEPFEYEWLENELRPCYHKNFAVSDSKYVLKDGALAIVGTCEGCGEAIATPLDNLLDASLGDNNKLLAEGEKLTSTSNKNIITGADAIGSEAGPYTLEFDLDVESINEKALYYTNGKDGALRTSGRTLFGGMKDTSYQHMLRMFHVMNGDKPYEDRAYVRIKDSASGPLVITIYEGHTYHFKLNVDPATGNISTEAYDLATPDIVITANGSVGSLGTTGNSWAFRFLDSTSGTYHMSNFYFFREAEVEGEVHVHTDKWCYMSEKGVEMTDDTFEPYYYCYCGEKVSYGTVNDIVVNNIPVVYKGTASVQAESLEGTWFTTDINIRDLEAGNGNLVKIGDTTVLQFMDGAIAYGTGGNAAIVDHVNTYSVAINFRADNRYDIYIDGKLCSMNHSYEGDSIITLGDEAFGENVRFYCNRLVKVGEGTELKPDYDIDETVRPHYHGNATTLYDIKIVVGNGVVYKSAICGDCGEKAKIGLNNLLTEDNGPGWVNNTLLNGESITFSSYKGIRVSPDIIGSNGIPYIVEFDLDVDVINENTIRFDGANVRKNGRTLFGTYADTSATVSTNSFQHFLRLFVVPDETTADANDYIDGKAYLRIGESEDKSPLVTTIEEGHSYHFAMYVDPVNRKITVNSWDLNDESTFSVTNGTINDIGTQRSDYRFRFLDGGWGTFTVNQFAFYNNDTSGDVFHTHSDEWLTNDENTNTTIIRTEDHKLAYSYECYCGQTVTYGISEVIKESVMPAYGITGEEVVISALEIPENDFWLVGDISAMELPAEDGKALVTIGDKVLLGINKDGELASDDGVGCAVKLVADDEYHSLAFRFDVSKKAYTVYLDGAYVTDASYKTLAGDVKIASEGAGKYHFDQVAVVVLAEDGDIAYKVAEGVHTHEYLVGDASLEFNAERSTITINYICEICNRPAFDGIETNLYDDEDTDAVESILPVFGTESVIIEDSDILTGYKPYWISFDATLTAELAQGRGSIFAFANDEGEAINILTLYTNGTLVDASGKTLEAKLGTTATNITINVINSADKSAYVLYVDGIYCGEYELALNAELTYDVVVGADFATTLEITDIKFAEMANGGTLEIGTFVCANDEHVPTINKNTYVEYLDVNEFKVVSRCEKCGAIITEEIVDSFYESTSHIYDAYGEPGVVSGEADSDRYWIVADVNVRGYIGSFIGYVPLISNEGKAALLINSDGELMLGDGTRVGYALSAACTYNIALKFDSGVYHLFIDGQYKGSTTGENFKEGIKAESGREYFGSTELKNIRYYNIKSVVTGVTDAPMSVEFVADPSVLPCVHEHHSFHDVTVMLDEQIKEVYICSKCGERVLRVNNKDVLDYSANSFIEDGAFEIKSSKLIESSENILSRDGDPYWLRFTINFEDIAAAEKLNNQQGGAGRKGGVTLLGIKSGSSYPTFLRMFTIEDGKGGYLEGAVEIRNANSRTSDLIAVVREGETHDFAIGVVPSSGLFRIYMDGKLIAQRTTTSLAADRGEYSFRILDGNWGTFNFSNFEFVSADGHTHTAKYAQYIDGGYDVLAYTDSTLTHRYTCYCGAEIAEGIDRIYVDPITKVDGATAFTAINGGKEITMGADPYWFSAKVFTKGTAANIFSYGEDERMVEIKTPDVAEGEEEQPIMFFVDGVATYVEPSANGDYDVISVMVNPVTGEYDVYVNGSYLASGDAGFKQNENFNILLGGAGSDVAYSNLKLVGLKDGATGEVANCGDHSFKNSGMVIKYVATEGKITSLTYVCSFCGEEVIRTVTPDTVVYQTGMNTGGNRVVIRSDPKTTEGSDEIKYDTDYFDELVDMNYEGSRWLTFEAKPIDLKIAEGKNNAFVCWVYDYNHGLPVDPATGKTPDGTAYSRFFRAYYVDDKTVEVRITRGGTNHVAAIGSPTMTEGKTYKFAIEYFTSTGVYYAYMSEADSDVLKFIGEGKLAALDYSVNGNPHKDGADKNEEYGIRFGDGNIGNVTISNVNVFNGTVADRPVEDTSIEIKSHFPADNAPGTMSYVDGQIYHEFVCGCGCNKTIKNTVLNSLQNPALNNNKVFTEVLNISAPKKLYVDKELITNGGTPFYLAFELTPDKINTDDIKRKTEKNKNGASILALLGETAGTSAIQVDLLRACYRNGRVVLDCPLDTGNEFELEIVEGETYNFVFAINPTTGRIICSVNGTTIDYNKVSKLDTSKENYSIRFLDNHEGVWGQYDFTNIKFGYMVDECAHTGKTCVEAGGKKTYICDDCGNTAFAAHNYISVVDSTGKWTLYMCEDCEEVFVVFNDISLIADLEFATYDELMEYLVMEYPPMFIMIME